MNSAKTGKSQPPRHNSDMKVQDQQIKESLSLIKHKLLVMSGKGGVGKTSVAVNLALALSKIGKKVGLMDVDLHGPDVPKMLGLKGLLEVSAGGRFIPKPYSDRLEIVSIESMTDKVDEAVIWRGPLKMHVIRQFLYDVHWGRLDYLLVDSPPGTGDEPLTVAQTIEGANAIIVTTPQEISLADVRKAISFCRTMKMPILGLVENMSGFICPHCGNSMNLFGKGGGLRTARDADLTMLAEIPFDPKMVSCSDNGRSLLEEYPTSEVTKAYGQMAETIVEKYDRKKEGGQSPSEKSQKGAEALKPAFKWPKLGDPPFVQ